MIKVGIIGGAGYTAGELIRILLGHPDAEIVFVNSTSNAGNKLSAVHEGLIGETDMVFTDQLPLDTIDVLFFCTAHGDTRKFMEANTLPEGLKVIDLSMDYRLEAEGNPFIYGLPELNRRAICQTRFVANPGNFATGILLGLLPLGRNLMLSGDIAVMSIIGSTGTGEQSTTLTSFNWRSDNVSVYKPFVHQHLPEIEAALRQQQTSFNASIHFVPCHGNFTRGIFTTIMLKNSVSLGTLEDLYETYYEEDSFTYLSRKPIDPKQVVHTNRCFIHLDKQDDNLLITTCIDNLLKGASGQAVHNMNLLFNLEETVGLNLKSTAY